MQGIYNYTPETHHVYIVYCFVAALYLQSVLHVMLFGPCNNFLYFTLEPPAEYVQCPIWLFFCCSLISLFPGMLLRYCLSDSEKVYYSLRMNCYYYYYYYYYHCYHCYHLYVVYLQLYTGKNPVFLLYTVLQLLCIYSLRYM